MSLVPIVVAALAAVSLGCSKKSGGSSSEKDGGGDGGETPLCQATPEAAECQPGNNPNDPNNIAAAGVLAINLDGAIALGVGASEGAGLALTDGGGELVKILEDGSTQSVMSGVEGIQVTGVHVAPDKRLFISTKTGVARKQFPVGANLVNDEEDPNEPCFLIYADGSDVGCVEFNGFGTNFAFTTDSTFYRMSKEDDSGIRRLNEDKSVEKMPFDLNSKLSAHEDLLISFIDDTLSITKGDDSDTIDLEDIRTADVFPDGKLYSVTNGDYVRIDLETKAVESIFYGDDLCGMEEDLTLTEGVDKCESWVGASMRVGERMYAKASNGDGVYQTYPAFAEVIPSTLKEVQTAVDGDSLIVLGRQSNKSKIMKVDAANAVTTLYETSDRINSMTVADGKILFSGVKGLKPVTGTLGLDGGEAVVVEGGIELVQVEAVK